MTEDEAKKILDFLVRRFERTSSMLIDKFSRDNTTDNLLVRTKYNGLFLVWIWNLDPNDRVNFGTTVKIYSEMTATKIVSCLLNHAKTHDLVVSSYELVFKGETPEELLVKADLEDFD